MMGNGKSVCCSAVNSHYQFYGGRLFLDVNRKKMKLLLQPWMDRNFRGTDSLMKLSLLWQNIIKILPIFDYSASQAH
jgi:hypothetical protein